MDYLCVLDHLKEFKVDRIIVSDFSKAWTTSGTVTVELETSHASVHDNSLKVSGMAKDAFIYALREATATDGTRKAFRMDDRQNMQLHIYPEDNVTEGILELILSDSKNLTTAILTLEVPALVAGVMNILNIEIPKADRGSLSNIKTVGIRATAALTTTIYIALCNATTPEYIVTVEDMEMKIDDGTNYVMSKLGPDYTTLPEDKELEGAVYLAAAGYAWMKQKENEQYQFDYGNQTTTKNYGVHLLSRAKMIVNSYLAGGDAETGASTEVGVNYINTDLLGGHTVGRKCRRRFR